MKAHLNSARIAPKKANLVAKMVRGMTAADALKALRHTHKKGARMIETLLVSALANAEHNDKQDSSALVIKTIVVNQGTHYRRAIPKARGSVRPIRKFMSHISLTLGVAEEKEAKKATEKKKANASQTAKKTVKSTPASSNKKNAEGDISSDSSSSSAS
jgi:large subunit ribosomal protein L22